MQTGPHRFGAVQTVRIEDIDDEYDDVPNGSALAIALVSIGACVVFWGGVFYAVYRWLW